MDNKKIIKKQIYTIKITTFDNVTTGIERTNVLLLWN